MQDYAVYITINIAEPDKFYVGMFRLRHTSHDAYYLGSGRNITAAIKELGRAAFRKTIVARFETLDEAGEVEAALIEALDPFYNIAPGGRQGSGLYLQEYLRQHPEARLPSHSPEARAKHAAAMRGRKLSASHRAKLRRPKSTTVNMRGPKSASHCASFSAARRGDIRITDGISNRIIRDLADMPSGWRRGLTRKNSTSTITH